MGSSFPFVLSIDMDAARVQNGDDVQCATQMISPISESIAHLRGALAAAQGLTASSKTDMVTDSLTVADIELEHVQKILNKIITQNEGHEQFAQEDQRNLFTSCRARSRSPVSKERM